LIGGGEQGFFRANASRLCIMIKRIVQATPDSVVSKLVDTAAPNDLIGKRTLAAESLEQSNA